jgi:hypothetical protein
LPAPDLKNIAFIDLEASGLSARSWPIEVGWCFADAKPEALLIKPSADWSLDEWSPEAEALHGLSHKKIVAKGLDSKVVCEKLNAALSGRDVYSDAPDWDGFWLYRLFQAAKLRQAFKLSDLNGLFRTTPPAKLNAILHEAAQRAPRKHRAAADVVHMRTIFELAFGK